MFFQKSFGPSTTAPAFTPFFLYLPVSSSALPTSLSLIFLLFLPREGLDATQILAVRESVRGWKGSSRPSLPVGLTLLTENHHTHEHWRDPLSVSSPVQWRCAQAVKGLRRLVCIISLDFFLSFIFLLFSSFFVFLFMIILLSRFLCVESPRPFYHSCLAC